MIARLIKKQAFIGSSVKFSLKTGGTISGVIVEIGEDYIVLKYENGTSTILFDVIGAWEIIENVGKNSQEKTTSTEVTVNAEVIKKITEIETRYNSEIQSATIELKIPDFSLNSEDAEYLKKDIEPILNRIKNKYEYAKKINELEARYGRINPIVTELSLLIDKYPSSVTLKRCLSYFYILINKVLESKKLYSELVVKTRNNEDWFNFGVLELKSNEETIACYALEQFFQKTPIVQEQNAWFVYIGLVNKFHNFTALKRFIDAKLSSLTDNEAVVLFETGIYLLKATGKEERAENLVQQMRGQPIKSLLPEVFNYFEEQPTELYEQAIVEIEKKLKENSQPKQASRPQGYIYKYNKDRYFGFLKGLDGKDYFFHGTAIIDETLFDKLKSLEPGGQILVDFESTQGQKGLIAIQISLHRTIDEMYQLAVKYAESGEYPKAINQIKRVLLIDPNYVNANSLNEKWREYARLSGVPKGLNPYDRAKRVQLIEKNLEGAVDLFREAIAKGDNVESAVKDLASLLVQLGRPQEAIEVLEKNLEKVRNRQSLDNILTLVYKSAGQYDKAISLLKGNINLAINTEKKVQILWEIANCYLKKEDYQEAYESFKDVLNYRPDNIPVKRNIALCFLKQERYDEAERTLKQILESFPDEKSRQLLEAIVQAKNRVPALVDEMIIETTLSEFSGPISVFSQFFLKHCGFQGVAPDRIKEKEDGQKEYTGSERDAKSDMDRLENIAKQLGTRRPRDRAEYYLSAAQIAQKFGEDSNLFYRYLCRSFSSRGDVAISENRPLDTAREWYCEALNVYAMVRSQRIDEQDALNALVRFLHSLLGFGQIPLTPEIPTIDESLENVLNLSPQREKVFEFIAYLVLRSLYAANRILNKLYIKTSLQAMALDFLKNQNLPMPANITQQEFIRLWSTLSKKKLDDIHSITVELRLLRNLEFTTAWLVNTIERVRSIENKCLFDLDKQRIRQLIKILETCLDLCKQAAFEEKERICNLIDGRCKDLLEEIEISPTKLSIEEVYQVIQTIKEKTKAYLDNLYETSVPEVTLQLPIESYCPDNKQIEVQISVENKVGKSPAESMELIVQEDDTFFSLNEGNIRIDESLIGGQHSILRVPIRLTDLAIQSQTFSLSVYAQYRTRSEDIKQTYVYNFSIRLYKEEEFEEIPNPYSAYAEGGIVSDPQMFYGRDELIENIAKAIENSRLQSKCIVIFGQKRAGKSSILHYLKERMKEFKDLIILDLGSTGTMLDEYSSIPFTYQFFWSILRGLKDAIEDLAESGVEPLDFQIPSSDEFYKNQTPLLYFKQIFDNYKRRASKSDYWNKLRLVVFIDEFSYIYSQIISGRMNDLFMKNWKALLQENYFSSVLVGQDIMPKFKQRFPNEFGTTQDERVTYLKIEDATKLIEEPIKKGGKNGESRYRERAVERILELTAGSPFYIQIFCNRLVEYMNRKHAPLVTKADVENVKNELIQGVNSLSSDKFDNLVDSGDTSKDAIGIDDALKVLRAIAINSKTGRCSRNSIVCQTKASLNAILDDLVNRDVLKCEDEMYYQIRVGLFEEWLIVNQ